jgi:hypothetical protein
MLLISGQISSSKRISDSVVWYSWCYTACAWTFGFLLISQVWLWYRFAYYVRFGVESMRKLVSKYFFSDFPHWSLGKCFLTFFPTHHSLVFAHCFVRWLVGDYFFLQSNWYPIWITVQTVGYLFLYLFLFFSFISPLLLAHFSFRLVRISPLVQALRFVLSKSSPISFFVLRWFYWMMRLRREDSGTVVCWMVLKGRIVSIFNGWMFEVDPVQAWSVTMMICFLVSVLGVGSTKRGGGVGRRWRCERLTLDGAIQVLSLASGITFKNLM